MNIGVSNISFGKLHVMDDSSNEHFIDPKSVQKIYYNDSYFMVYDKKDHSKAPIYIKKNTNNPDEYYRFLQCYDFAAKYPNVDISYN